VARHEPLPPGLRFETRTIEAFEAGDGYDLIFSNAAFHWVEDHDALIRRLFRGLRPGGQLAFQIPAMHSTPSHAMADELAITEFRTAFNGWTRPQPVLEPEEYARLLFKVGFRDPRVRLAIYPHVLASREDVIEWIRGTLLTEYEKRITADQFAAFVEAYRRRLLPQLADERPYFYPFRRILCWGRRIT